MRRVRLIPRFSDEWATDECGPSWVRVTCSSAGSSSLVAALGSSSLVAALGQVDVLVLEGFAVQDRRFALRRPLPGRDVGEVLVVAERLALGGLALGAEVTAAALATVQGVDAHELGEFDEVGDPAGVLEGLVERVPLAGHLEVGPELPADLGDPVERLAEALLRALHAAHVPHQLAELPVEGRRGAAAVDAE